VGFKDHFSERSSAYARARPTYPPELFDTLAKLTPAQTAAWDVGTGNGQAALGLAEHFAEVLATDASAAQIAEAPTHSRVTFRVGTEAASGLPDRSVDLISVAQALHWFDLQAFYPVALRVLRPGGILAVWCYGLCRISPEVDALVDRFYSSTVGPYWPPERSHIITGYRELSFPLPDLPFPQAQMELCWTLPDLVAYLRTWSAVSAYEKAHRVDPVVPLEMELAGPWGPSQNLRTVTWPLTGRLGRAPV
jgi:SAM-dependent methyltransferase